MSDKQSLAEMKKELRELRKNSVKPVSRMRKGDIASELEKLKGTREETPPVAAVPGQKQKKMEAKISDVKVAKEHGFPVAPSEDKKKAPKKAAGLAGKTAASDGSKKKNSKLEKLMKLMEAMSSDEE